MTSPTEQRFTDGELTRIVKSILHQTFPSTKFAVSVSRRQIEWTDDGPTVAEVQDVIVATGHAKNIKAWNGERYVSLHSGGNNLWFNRFNIAEREAARRDRERRREAYEAEKKREREALEQAAAARRAALPARPLRQAEHAPPDPAVFEAFECLRQRAEAATAADSDSKRRPSWAPPLLLGEELAEACLELGYLTLDDKWIGRLWAEFASPKRTGKYLRENVSAHPLHGISCRGFQLFAGGSRQSVSELLFETQREDNGTWRFGPSLYFSEYHSPRASEWSGLIRESARLHHEIEHCAASLSEERRTQIDARIAEIGSKIGRIDAEDTVDAGKYHERQRLKQRVLDLAQARVKDFIGAPAAQMQAASRLCGHCCRCWKELTDPISLERGIGPDCHANLIGFIQRHAAEGYSLEHISILAGASVEFINTVIAEAPAACRSAAL
jgi:hypothetical protein